MAGVFINYRAKDHPLGAAAIAKILADRFGEDRVFRDDDSLEAGVDYPSTIRAAVKDADVLVAVIGPQWLEVTEPGTTNRRIDSEHDWVRMEIAWALEHDIPIVPVLLTDMPKNARAARHEELPENIREFASKQPLKISQQRFAQDMALLVDRLVSLAPALIIPQLFAQPPVPITEDSAPSTLLRPEYEVVPFVGRERELADLTAWAKDSAACSVRLIVGAAGYGKTRLAVQLCRRLTDDGWLAGLISGEAPAAQIRHTSVIDKPLLAVVDDVELRSGQLIALAAAVGERSAARNAPARLLLLGRSDGGWLRDLRNHRDERVAGLFRPVGRATTSLGADLFDAHEQFRAAGRAFADALGVPVLEGLLPHSGAYDRLLDVHTLALDTLIAQAGLGAESVQGEGHPLALLLRHDRQHWRRRVSADGTPHRDAMAMAVIGTLATLCVPASTDHAKALLARLPDFLAEEEAVVMRYVDWWGRLFPGPYPINPMRPESLGEHLVVDTLTRRPAIVVSLVTTFPDDWLTTTLIVLGRALPRHPELREPIANLVRAAPSRIALLAVEMIDRLEEPEPFARAVAAEMGGTEWGIDRISQLMDRLQTASSAHDPMRGAAYDGFVETFSKLRANIQAESGYPATDSASPLLPFQRVCENLAKLVQDGVVGFLDPGSGRFPKGSDGKSIVPEELAETLRKLVMEGKWFGTGDEK